MKLELNALDSLIATAMRRGGPSAMRLSIGALFVWFGILKPLGLSAAEPLVRATVAWMPWFDPGTWVALIGIWEVAIGIAFLLGLTRTAIALLFLQMIGTFMPLLLLPDVTFQAGRIPYAPTMEGQYIFKNLVIISGALIVGGTVRTRPSATGH